jgi:xylitol oxidase
MSTGSVAGSDQRLNWSEHITFGATAIHHPATLDEVRALVAAASKVRAFGARHSFNAIADTTGDHLSLERLDRVVGIDPERRTVTVEGGIRYAELGPQLEAAGFALHNLASLPHVSVAGAVATATHGSGDRNGNLATAVSGLELVTAEGDVVTLSREKDGDAFLGAVVGLGALGIVTKLTLDLQPTFTVRQTIYDDLSEARLLEDFDGIVGGAYSVSLFTDWRDERIRQTWVKRREGVDTMPEEGADYFGATPAPRPRTLSETSAPSNVTEQHGVPGPWHERLPHFRPHVMPGGNELQSEYFVPRQHAVAAIRALGTLRARIAPLVKLSEYRTMTADNLWMSMAYGRDTVGLHFTWKKDWDSVSQLLPAIEEQLAPFDARPHWGKLFTMDAARVQALYPKLADFRALVQRYDPQGKFRNAFLDRYVFGE